MCQCTRRHSLEGLRVVTSLSTITDAVTRPTPNRYRATLEEPSPGGRLGVGPG
jgi:hypothetical protein